MARRVKKEDRWLSPYTNAFAYKHKNGMAYISIHSKIRKTTGYEFKPSNKRAVMELLEKELRLYQFPEEKNKPQRKLLSEVIAEFKKIHIDNKSPQTKALYKNAFEQIFTSDCYIDDLDELKKMVESFVYEPVFSDKTKSELNINTKLIYITNVTTFFNFCLEFNYFKEFPFSKRILPKEKKKEILNFTEEEYSKIFRYLIKKKDFDFYYFIRIAQITGARIHEVFNLKKSDIYFIDDPRKAKIVFKGKAGKDGNKRDRNFPLYLFPFLAKIIYKFYNGESDKIIRFSHKQTLVNNFRKILDKLNISSEKSFHTIRKTTLTWWRGQRISAEDRALLSGHSVDMEIKVYNANPDSEYFLENYQKKEFLK